MIVPSLGETHSQVMCNTCGALGRPVPGRSWRQARDAAPAGWLVGRGLDTDDVCTICRQQPATRPLLEEILELA